MGELLCRVHGSCVSLTQRIALIAIVGMLAVAVLTVCDVLLRYLFNSPILGFYELAESAMAVVVSACFPAVLAAQKNLTVDFLSNFFGERIGQLLELLGGLCVLGFVSLLSWQVFNHADALDGRNAISPILLLPVAPVYWLIATLLALGVFVQAVIVLVHSQKLIQSLRAEGKPHYGPAASRQAGRRISMGQVCATALLGVAVLGIALLLGAGSLFSIDLSTQAITVVMIGFVVMFAVVMLQVPIGAAMCLVGLAGIVATMGSAIPGLHFLGIRSADLLSNLDLAAVPLFIMMGEFSVAAGLSSDVYRLANTLLGHKRGGLALATIGGCAGFGAVTGSSVATAATLGRVALPEMLSRDYSDSLATGSLAAGGTLGMLVPPSAMMVIYAILTETSITRIFIAAIIPAAIAALFYMLTISIWVRINPLAGPAGRRSTLNEILSALGRSWGILLLFGLVIGGLYGGVFTATEAAAVGAGGAFLFALFRGKLGGSALWQVLGQTAATTAMLYMLVLGASLFSLFVGVTRLPNEIVDWINLFDFAPLVVISLILLVYIFLGAFMDPFTMLLITVPVVIPLVSSFGYDLTWWGILTIMVIEIGLITPPLGLNVFVIRIVAQNISIGTIYRGVAPFIAADLVRLAIMMFFPFIALWLPQTVQ